MVAYCSFSGESYHWGGRRHLAAFILAECLAAIDADPHADLERLLLDNGSAQEDLWGFNLWVEEESSFAQQMANIGSETSRVYRALVSGKESRAESSFAR